LSNLFGEAFVRIRPDASGFAAEVAAQIRRQVATVAPSVPVGADLSNFRRQTETGIRRTLAETRAVATITPDLSSFGAAAERSVQTSLRDVRAAIPLAPDAARFERDASAAIRTALPRIAASAGAVPIHPDTARFSSEARAGIGNVIGSVAANLPPVRLRTDVTTLRRDLDAGLRTAVASVSTRAAGAAVTIPVRPDTTRFAAEAAAGVEASMLSLRGGTSTSVPLHADTTRLAAEAAAGARAATAAVPKSARSIPFLPDLSNLSKVTRPVALLAQGAGLGGFSGAIARGGAAAGIIALGAAAVTVAKQAGTLEQSLNVLAATSGATKTQMAAISAEARRLGADVHLPAVSASDAATAMLELSKSGVSVRDSMAGARGALELATAGQIAVADAAKIAGTTLNTFSLSGDKVTHIADLLAGASNAAGGGVADFAAGLAQAGVVTEQFGLSADQTVAALTLLARKGILASDAGTSLKVALQQLLSPSQEAQGVMEALGVSIQDQAGNILPLNDVLDQYRTQLAKLPPALQAQAKAQLVGTDGIRAFNILLAASSGEIDRTAAAIGKAGTAQRLADAQTKGLLGSVSGLSSQLQTLATDLGTPLLGPLTTFTNALSTAVADTDTIVLKLVEDIGRLKDVKLPKLPGLPQAPGGGTLGGLAKNIIEITSGTKLLIEAGKLVDKTFSHAGDKIKDANAKARDLQVKLPPATFGALGIPALKAPAVPEADKTKAKSDAHKLGADLTAALGTGISSGQAAAIAQARQTLAQVIAAGKEQVAQAIAQAQQQATSIGADLAQKAAQAIDVGPIGARVAQLTSQLAASQAAQQRATLVRGVQAAKTALAGAIAASRAAGDQVVANMRAQAARIKAELGRIDAQIAGIQKAAAARAAAQTAAQLQRSLADAQAAVRQGQRAAADAQRDLQRAREDLLVAGPGGVQNAAGQSASGNLVQLPKINLGFGDTQQAIQDVRQGLQAVTGDALKFFDTIQQPVSIEFAPGQQAAVDDFLRPIAERAQDAQDNVASLVQGVADAAAAIREFNQQQREQAQVAALEARKAAIEHAQAAAEAKASAAEARKQAAAEAAANRQRIVDARIALVDARTALKDFNTQAIITQLQKTLEAQKKAVSQGIADIVNQFNQGRITLPRANAQIAALLGAQGVNWNAAGAKLGTAFRDGVLAQIRNLRAQMQAIIAGPFKPGAGLVQKPVSPAQVQAQARQAVNAARADLQQAQLKKMDAQTELQKKILAALGKTNTTGSKTEKNTRPKTRGGRQTQSAVDRARDSAGTRGALGGYDPRCRTGRC
jgi:TP901 family phage tail tape measure protein